MRNALRGSFTRKAVVVLAGALVAAACSGASGESADLTTTTTEATTTTTTAPLTIEEQVEQAYLYSWEVYTEGMADADASSLPEAFSGWGLEVAAADIEALIAEGHAAEIDVVHDYTIELQDDRTAVIVDRFENHSVLVDPSTREPLEPDPDNELTSIYLLELTGGTWKVTDITPL